MKTTTRVLIRRRTLWGSVLAGGLAIALIAPLAPASGAGPAGEVTAVPAAVPAALDTCQAPGNAFVSLEVAPEVVGAVPIGAGYHRLWDLGVAWKDVNPAPGIFIPDTLDQEVAQARASGAIPLYVFGLTPQWAAADPNAGDGRWGAGTASPPTDMATWDAYVTWVVSRYAGNIGAYEVWNEANLDTFWRGSPAQMAEMTRRAYKIIKDLDPAAVVIAASVTTRLRSPMEAFMTPYAQALRDLKFPIDAWAIHSYPAGNQGPPERKADVRNWQQVVANALGVTSPGLDLQVWDTEVNYGLAGPGGVAGTAYSDAQGAELISQTFADSLALGIDATFWYMYTAGTFGLLGVQLNSGTPQSRAALNAARSTYNGGANLCSSVPGGSSGGTSSGSGGSSAARSISIGCTRDKTGKQAVVAGSSTGMPGGAVTVYMAFGRSKKFKPVASGIVFSDGSISVSRFTSKTTPVRAYVQVGDTKSNVVVCPS